MKKKSAVPSKGTKEETADCVEESPNVGESETGELLHELSPEGEIQCNKELETDLCSDTGEEPCSSETESESWIEDSTDTDSDSSSEASSVDSESASEDARDTEESCSSDEEGDEDTVERLLIDVSFIMLIQCAGSMYQRRQR
jgi:hypothetical protein